MIGRSMKNGAEKTRETVRRAGAGWLAAVSERPALRRALECAARGKVPFYCCAWSNIRSARNAVRSGFRPAWAQLTVKPEAEIARLNGAD